VYCELLDLESRLNDAFPGDGGLCGGQYHAIGQGQVNDTADCITQSELDLCGVWPHYPSVVAECTSTVCQQVSAGKTAWQHNVVQDRGVAYQALLPSDSRIPSTYCRFDERPPGTPDV
jgi:hypothetical protein